MAAQLREAACRWAAAGANRRMPHLGSWIQGKRRREFSPGFSPPHPEIALSNARLAPVDLATLDGLLVTGGPDIAAEFHREPLRDPSLIQDPEPERDAWEFAAVRAACERGLPIFAICKGVQVLNVALGGTLHLDIRGHDLPEMKTGNVQPLRFDDERAAPFRDGEQLASPGARPRGRCARNRGLARRRRHHRAGAAARLSVGRGRPVSSGARFDLRDPLRGLLRAAQIDPRIIAMSPHPSSISPSAAASTSPTTRPLHADDPAHPAAARSVAAHRGASSSRFAPTAPVENHEDVARQHRPSLHPARRAAPTMRHDSLIAVPSRAGESRGRSIDAGAGRRAVLRTCSATRCRAATATRTG